MKFFCYCVKCEGETEMIVVRTLLNNRNKEKKIKGFCKTCREPMYLITYFSDDPDDSKIKKIQANLNQD